MSVNNQITSNSNIKEDTSRLTSSSSSNSTTPNNIKPQVFQNTTNLSNRVLAKPISKLQQLTNTTAPSINTTTNAPKNNLKQHRSSITSIQKRSNTLNTKTTYRLQLIDKSFAQTQTISNNDKIYSITDLFAESSDYLFNFNNQLIIQKNISISNISSLRKKLKCLIEFVEVQVKAPLNTSDKKNNDSVQMTSASPPPPPPPPQFSLQSFTFAIERIEYVTKRLNDEMLRLIDFFFWIQKITILLLAKNQTSQ